MSNEHPPVRSVEERNRLVEQFRYLPRHVVNAIKDHPRIQRFGEDDAESVGYRALIRAADLWDETRGVKFITYAYHCIYRQIWRAARRSSLIYVPEKAWFQGVRPPNRVLAVRKRAAVGKGRERDYDPLCKVADKYAEPERHEDLEAAMLCLPPRWRWVIEQRFWTDRTLREIGLDLGCTHERVRQMEADGIDRLRNRLRQIEKDRAARQRRVVWQPRDEERTSA